MRFRVSCRYKGSDMRMELPEDDTVREVGDTVSEVLGINGFVLRNGYRLLEPVDRIGDGISEGDTVEVMPDPEALIGRLPMGAGGFP